jgi:hypothetical protein
MPHDVEAKDLLKINEFIFFNGLNNFIYKLKGN